MQEMDEIDGARFAKLCKDCKLHSRTFTSTDGDIFFASVKTKVGCTLCTSIRAVTGCSLLLMYILLQICAMVLDGHPQVHIPSTQACS